MTTTANSTPLAQQRATPKPLRGLSSSSNLANDTLRSDSLSDGRKKTSERGPVKGFMGVFRKTSASSSVPPPDIPSEGSKKKGKLSSLWPFLKRHEHKKESRPQRGRFRLPDSAVAGTTTGGHRHIAISIPIEHAHLDPTVHKSTIPPARPHGEPDEGNNTGDGSEDPERQRRGETPYITNNGSGVPPRDPTVPDNSAGTHMVATSSRELTSLKRSASAETYLTNPWSEQRQPPRRRPSQGRSTEQGVLPNTRCSMNRQFVRKRSSSESFYSTTSEVISSDAVTVHIPSPEPFETGTDRYFTPKPAESRISVGGQGPRKTTSISENSSQGFNLSAPYNGSSSRTSSMPEPNRPFLTPHTDTPSQPHALSNITSLESPIPSSLGRRALHVAPVMTVADIKPSSPHRAPLRSGTNKTPEARHRRHHSTHIMNPNNERHPRRVHAFPDIRSTNHSHASLHPSQPPNEEPGTSAPFLTTTAANSDPSTQYAVPPSASPAPRPFLHHHLNSKTREEQTGNKPEIQRGRARENDIDLLHRHHTPRTITTSQAHDREMARLPARLSNLEQANTRWTNTVVPLLNRVSRQLASPSAGNMGMGSERLGYRPGGAGSGAGGSTDYSRRSPSRSLARDGGSSGFGGAGYYGNGGVFTPARLESAASLGRGGYGEPDDLRYRESRRVGVRRGGGERRVQDRGVVENNTAAGDGPWSRTDSSYSVGYLGSSSREIVFDVPPYCRGALMPPDAMASRLRSARSSGGDGGRDTTSPETQSDSSVRQEQNQQKQQIQNGDGPLEDGGDDGNSGDVTGLASLDRLMRELIPTTRPTDKTDWESELSSSS